MSFDCCLTTDNQIEYEKNILELIEVYRVRNSTVVLCFIIVLMLEYLLSYQYINTNEIVHQEAAFRKANLSNQGISAVQLMRAIRNNIIHSPNKIKPRMLQVFYSMLSDQVIDELTNFYVSGSDASEFLRSLSVSKTGSAYTNIEKYKRQFNMTDDMFKDDMQRLMLVLNVHTIEELNERIVDLL